MRNIYKSKAERLKGDPFIGVCNQALETLSACEDHMHIRLL